MSAPITFLSDFGAGSDYVGICHAVIARVAPDARIIDLGHAVPRGDVRAGAHILARAVPHCEPGVHLAVVDPGVGTERRALAVGSADGRVFVGPDNGLLAGAITESGGASWVREVSESAFRREPVSRTFWGRDVFAPVAAAIAAGAAPDELGTDLDPAEISRGAPRLVEVGDGELRAAVVHVDEFGNVVLEATWSELLTAGLADAGSLLTDALSIVVGRLRAVASSGAAAYAEIAERALLVHPDSFGAVEIAMNGGSAAEELAIASGDVVTIARRQ